MWWERRASGRAAATGDPEPGLIRIAAAQPVLSGLSPRLRVRLEARLVLQWLPVLAELEAGARGATGGILLTEAPGCHGAQLAGGRWVRLANLRACLSQQGQGALFGIQLQGETTSIPSLSRGNHGTRKTNHWHNSNDHFVRALRGDV